jgi:hypothetical protein
MNLSLNSNECAHTKSELVKNTMLILKNFFTDVEKKGTVGVRQHKGVEAESYTVKRLLITTNANFFSKKGPKFLLFNINSSITLWELYDIAAKYFNKSPLKIVLTRMTLGKPDLTEADFSRSLADLRFEDNEELCVKNQNVNN